MFFVCLLLSYLAIFLFIFIFNFVYTNHSLVAIPVNWILPGTSIWSLCHITIQTTAALCPIFITVGLSTPSPSLPVIPWCLMMVSSEYLEYVCSCSCVPTPSLSTLTRPVPDARYGNSKSKPTACIVSRATVCGGSEPLVSEETEVPSKIRPAPY